VENKEILSHFVRGVIDGSLSTLGVVIGASSAESSLIIAAGMGGAIANSVSNILGAFSSEEYKSYTELNEIEDAMVTVDLDDTLLEKDAQKRTVQAGLLDGTATIMGGCVPVIPYLFSNNFLTLLISILLVMIILFVLGMVIGKMSDRQIMLSGAKLVIFGVLTAILVYFIQTSLI
jgi:predicted membrane protein (TIGR00267 family)